MAALTLWLRTVAHVDIIALPRDTQDEHMRVWRDRRAEQPPRALFFLAVSLEVREMRDGVQELGWASRGAIPSRIVVNSC